MQIDAREFSKTSEASKVSSCESDCTDKMVGLETSVPIGLIAGQITPTDSLVYKLREEIESSGNRLEERENEIAETSVDTYKQMTSNVDPLAEPGYYSMPSFGGLSSSEDFQAGSGDTCKMVGLGTSIKTDDKGVPLIEGECTTRKMRHIIMAPQIIMPVLNNYIPFNISPNDGKEKECCLNSIMYNIIMCVHGCVCTCTHCTYM